MAMGALAAAMATGSGDEIALKSGGVGGGGEGWWCRRSDLKRTLPVTGRRKGVARD
jgi:hypothetical protein